MEVFSGTPAFGSQPVSTKSTTSHGPEKGCKGSYSDEHLEQFADLARRNTPAYFMFNNVRMVEDAARFQGLVRQSVRR